MNKLHKGYAHVRIWFAMKKNIVIIWCLGIHKKQNSPDQAHEYAMWDISKKCFNIKWASVYIIYGPVLINMQKKS